MGVFDSKTKSAISSFFNNQISRIERKVESGLSPTNEPLSTVQTIYSSLPCQIESNKDGTLEYTIEGVTYLASHDCSIDGLMPSQVSGHNAGDVVTVNGIAYTVATLARGGFVDVQPNDRITDANGKKYLVLQISEVTDVIPHTLLRLYEGKTW